MTVTRLNVRLGGIADFQTRAVCGLLMTRLGH